MGLADVDQQDLPHLSLPALGRGLHDEELHDLQRRGRGVESVAVVDTVLRPEILCDEPALVDAEALVDVHPPLLDRLFPSHFDALLDARLHVDPPLELHQFLLPGLPHLLRVELLAAPVVVELLRETLPVHVLLGT